MDNEIIEVNVREELFFFYSRDVEGGKKCRVGDSFETGVRTEFLFC